MTDRKAEQHRSEIARYRYLLGYIRDDKTRELLNGLIKEAEEKSAAADATKRDHHSVEEPK